MQFKRFAVVTLMGAALMASGCNRATLAEKHSPVKVDSTDVKGIMRVTLEKRAAERIGLQTVAVRDEEVVLAGGTKTLKVVPYGALMYDTKGETWTFTNPTPLVFVRQHIVVESIVGDRAFLAEGPAVGTLVVTVGATELMGAEHKYGQ